MGVSVAVLLVMGGGWYVYDATAPQRAAKETARFCADMGSTPKDVEECLQILRR